MASHDKKGMIDRKEDETTEKSTLVADVSTPLPKKLSITQFTGLSVSVSEYSMSVCKDG